MCPVAARLRLVVDCTLHSRQGDRGCISQLGSIFVVCLSIVDDSHFSVIVISFQKSSDVASDAMLAVMMSCFTPAARAASRIRVVPETADYKESEVRDKMRT